MPAFWITWLGDRVGQQRREPVRELADRRAVGLHADRVDHRVGPRPSVSSRTPAGEVVAASSRSSASTPCAARAREALGHEVDADHLLDAAVLGDAACTSRRSGRARARARLPPSGTSAYSTACHAVGSTSER